LSSEKLKTKGAATAAAEPRKGANSMQILKLNPRALNDSPDDARRSKSSPQADALLLATVKAVGIIQPPVVSPETDGGNGYIIQAGHRRVKQAIAAGLEEIEVLATDAANDNGAMRSMIENIAREPLNAIDQWRGTERLVALGWTEEAIAMALALPVRQIRRLRLLANVLPAMLDRWPTATCRTSSSCAPSRPPHSMSRRKCGSRRSRRKATRRRGRIPCEHGKARLLLCLSRQALETAAIEVSLRPQPRVRDTRTAFVEHFKGEATFIHPAAFFAHDPREIADLIGHADEPDTDEPDADGAAGQGDATSDDAANDGDDSVDRGPTPAVDSEDPSGVAPHEAPDGLEAAYGIAAQ
jgi:ParB/RepB/Spo0J family partition protein